jgi:hypothetical protein
MLRFLRPETVARCARFISTEVLQGNRQKHKVPQKKASKLLNELKDEEFARLKAGRNFPEVRAGDSVVIEKLPYISATEPDIIKGLVIAKTNRASDTALRIWNVSIGYGLFFCSPHNH